MSTEGRTDRPRGIGAVAAQVGLDPDTLRYYERHGVLPAPARDPGGRRTYDADAVHLIEVLLNLRVTGMPLAQIAEFTRLVAGDPAGVPERLALLRQHRETVTERIRTWRTAVRVIDQKIADYEARVGDHRNGTSS